MTPFVCVQHFDHLRPLQNRAVIWSCQQRLRDMYVECGDLVNALGVNQIREYCSGADNVVEQAVMAVNIGYKRERLS